MLPLLDVNDHATNHDRSKQVSDINAMGSDRHRYWNKTSEEDRISQSVPFEQKHPGSREDGSINGQFNFLEYRYGGDSTKKVLKRDRDAEDSVNDRDPVI